MKILLVAPSVALPLVDDEIQDIINYGLNVNLLKGNVTAIELLRQITNNNYDLLYLATHGNKDGILLSDGLLDSSLLTSLVRGRIGAVYLNTCDSLATAQLIQNETDAEVVATIVEVPDATAYHTGSLFAYWLKQTNDVASSYERSKPGNNRTYVYLGKKK